MNKYGKADAAAPPSNAVVTSKDFGVVQKDERKIAGCFLGVCVNLPKSPIPIPGVPDGDPLGLAKAAIVKQIGEAVGVGSPLLLDQKTAYADVSDRVKDFHPQKLTITSAEDLQKPLPPGDYSLDVIAYCTQFSIHAPGQGLPYKLAPLMGKQAPAISALLSRGTLQGIAPATLNANAWRIQAGLPLKQWPPQDRALIHKLIPEYEKGLEGDYLQQIDNTYNQFRLVPGIPSLNDLLRQSGAPGQLVLQLRQARQTLADQTISAERLPDMLYEPTGDGLPRVLPAAKDSSPSPWAEVQPGIFARFTVIEGNLGRNLFEFRVTPKASAAINDNSDLVATKELDKKVLVSGQTGTPATPGSVVCNSNHITYSKDKPAQALIPACVSEGKAAEKKKHKGVVVYVWNYVGSTESWGHASIQLNDADEDIYKTYISWWPSNGVPYIDIPYIRDISFHAPAIPNRTLDQDIKSEYGKQADQIIYIPCIDADKIKSWWINEFLKANPEWKTLGQNCSKTVADALYAGGAADILTTWEEYAGVGSNIVWTPTKITRLANALAAHCPTTTK
ncbi:hypothetical protein I8752_00875 [Nostocaceae cyanobacterium CENA369]|uniref:Uncharacterized protein n=1 Tax=Dendronalium phyllosphericum CENA369 TaxID=1725256 RepID=A0A8J7LC43_9NOST|nr:hypothetical protein [Dendronalium phyllosphericum]MBH8571601.1 hypothetical protein [Dendronalium phyllosphericum CENA369]